MFLFNPAMEVEMNKEKEEAVEPDKGEAQPKQQGPQEDFDA